MSHSISERKRHIRIGRYLKDVVFAANDGVVTTFAVVAGTVGASLSPAIVIILGIANLFADGISMAAGNYLGTKSEMQFYQREREIEEHEIDTVPEDERTEVLDIVRDMGYGEPDAKQLTGLITSNRAFWLDTMMHKELGLFAPDGESPIKNALATFVSFAVAGFMPLIPYIFGIHATFSISIAITAITLFITGALRSYFSDKSWVVLGMETLAVGGCAAAVAYAVGLLLRHLVG